MSQNPSTQLQVLYEVSRSLSQLLELEQLIPFIISRTKELLNVESSAVLLLDEEKKELYFPYSDDVGPEVERRLSEIRFPADQGIAGWVVKHGESVLVPDVTKDPRWYPGVDRQTGMKTQSLICAPLRSRHGIVGVISLRNKLQGTFTEDDRSSLDALAGSIAIALENALLYAKVRESEAQLRQDVIRLNQEVAERLKAEAALQEEAAISAALARVGRELISSLEAPVLLERLCQNTARVLACDRSYTLIWEPDRRLFEPEAGFGASEEEREIALVLRLPREPIQPVLDRLAHEDVIETELPREFRHGHRPQDFGVGRHLVIALRRGEEIIGLQLAKQIDRTEPYTNRQLRIARGISQLASMALSNARLVEELDRANKLKSDFVATMSHELRTPLHIMMGYNDLLLNNQFGEINEEQTYALKRIEKSAVNLLGLVNQTLDMGRLEAGQMPVDFSDVDLNELIAELREETLELQQQKKELDFGWDVPPGLPRLRTDPAKVKVILKNLIDNAVKFTPRGKVLVTARASDGGAEIAVSDTGIGITPDFLPYIFDSFRQAEDVNTRCYGGLGLGLYIVRRLLDLVGGDVKVETAPKKGSTFTVVLPARGA